MKKYIISIFLIYFNCSFIIGQDASYAGELSVRVLNNFNYDYIEIQLELISSLCWNVIGEAGYENIHDLIDTYVGTIQSTTSNGITWKEFHFCFETPGLPETFGLGYYKVTAYVNSVYKDHFFIDYRTSSLPEDIPPPLGMQGTFDVVADFNVQTGKLYYYGTQTEFPSNNTIWGLKSWVRNIKAELEPLPPENFQLTSSGGFPYLSWSHSSSSGDYWTDYAIYRSVVSGCGSSAGSFTKISTLSKYTANYTDYDFIVGGPMTAYYNIVAVNGERESDATETKNICVGLYKEKVDKVNYDYRLNQNYPNPFNPSTHISFSIEENNNVSLKVFDILGREVAVLVDEYKIAGEYNVKFNAQNYESGIYFYEIKTGMFREAKKLLIIK